MKNKVVTRFAPSPTGTLHIGGARTALFNYLFTKKTGGKMILRIDDTDSERSRVEFEKDILESLGWLSLIDEDTEIIHQSERGDIYKKYIEDLIAKDLAYVSDEEKDGKKSSVIRFRNRGEKITFSDLIRGEISFETSDLGDFVIAKAIDKPLYHLASVVDDHELGITHVIRGEDHISNTPRQILLTMAIRGNPLQYAHIPLILAPDKSKLSKRHGALSTLEYKKEGYLKEAIINFLALLGWSPQGLGLDKKTEDILSLDDLVKYFDLSRVQKSGAIFNVEKLNWLNKEYLKEIPDKEFIDLANPYTPEKIINVLPKLVPLLKDRVEKLSDIKILTEEGEFDYLFESPTHNKELLKNTSFLNELTDILEKLDEGSFTQKHIKEAVWDFATEKGRGEVLWPMRVALTGKKKSPDPFIVSEHLGKEETIKRINEAAKL